MNPRKTYTTISHGVENKIIESSRIGVKTRLEKAKKSGKEQRGTDRQRERHTETETER